MTARRAPRPGACPTCGQTPKVERRSYGDRREYLQMAWRARARGLGVPAYLAAIRSGEIADAPPEDVERARAAGRTS